MECQGTVERFVISTGEHLLIIESHSVSVVFPPQRCRSLFDSSVFLFASVSFFSYELMIVRGFVHHYRNERQGQF